MNLYQISSRYQQLLDQDEYTNDELDELELLHGSVEDHIISHAKYIKNMEVEKLAIQYAVNEMETRIDNLTKNIDKQRSRLASYMQENKQSLVKNPLFNVKYSLNRPSVDDYDKPSIPKKFWRITEKTTVIESVDKEAIRKAIESGEDVPGALLIQKSKIEIK